MSNADSLPHIKRSLLALFCWYSPAQCFTRDMIHDAVVGTCSEAEADAALKSLVEDGALVEVSPDCWHRAAPAGAAPAPVVDLGGFEAFERNFCEQRLVAIMCGAIAIAEPKLGIVIQHG